MMSLIGELRRRNVFKVGAAYLAVAWLILQLINAVNEPLDLPAGFDTAVVVLLAIGFPLAVFFAWAYELTPQGIRATPRETDGAEKSQNSARGQALNYVIIGVLGLAIAVLLVERFDSSERIPATSTDSAAADAAEPASAAGAPAAGATDDGIAERIRLAVLPFRNLSSDTDVGYFADGLVVQLTTELRRIPELLVTDARAATGAAAASRSLAEIAAALGVEYLLEGTVSDGNETLRASLTLTRMADGEQLWDDSFDFSDTDTLTMRDQITGSVASALSVRLGVLSSRTSWMTENVEAYNALLSGLGHSGRFSGDETRAAIRSFERAIALDPDFLFARINLANAYRQMVVLARSDADRSQWRERVESTMERARDFADDAAAIALLDGLEAFAAGDWLSIESSIHTLDSIGFDNGRRSQTLGALYLRTGRTAEAIPWLEEARAVDPRDPAAALALSSAYSWHGDDDDAMAEVERGIELSADGQLRALALGNAWLTPLTAGDRDEFVRRMQSIPQSASGIPEAMLSRIDDPDAALAEIRRRLVEDTAMLNVDKGSLAHFAAFFGDYELALEIIRSLPADEPFLTMMLWPQVQAGTRRLPGFRELVTDLGLVSYWREYGWSDYCRPLGGDDFVCE